MHRSFPFEERKLPKEGPTVAELRAMGALLPGGVKELVSLRGRHWRALGLDLEQLSDDEVVQELLKDPLSLRRPILWRENGLVVGYRAEGYKELQGL